MNQIRTEEGAEQRGQGGGEERGKGMGEDRRGKGKGRRGEEKRGGCRKSSGCSGTLGMSRLGDWQRLPIRGTLCLAEISSALHSGNAENRVGGVGRAQPECERAGLEDSCWSEVASQQHFIERVLLDRDLSNTSTKQI